MIKKCIVCGAEFNAKQSNYCICSDDCRRIRQQKQNAELNKANYEKYKFNAKMAQRRKSKIFCKICGKIVHQHMGEVRMTSKHYHEDCVIREGIQAIKDKAKSTDKRLVRARNRYGYTMAELKEIMDNRSTVQKLQRQALQVPF